MIYLVFNYSLLIAAILRSFYNYCFGVFVLLFLSCAGNTSGTEVENTGTLSNLLHGITKAISSGPSRLTPSEYAIWVQEHKGITFNEVENDQFALRLIFHPAQLEAYTAAVANNEDPKKSHANYLFIQKGYYYCTAECVTKYESASAPIKKNELLALVKKQLTVVENNKDTLRTIITEAFPSYVMNQPNKLLILIPNTDSLSSYTINIQGSPFNLKDCQLHLTSEDIQSFPFIKL